MFDRLPSWFRFLIVGGINTAFGYALFVGLILLGASRLTAVVAATALGVVFNFHTIGKHVFANRDLALLPRFLGVYTVQVCVNSIALTLLGRLGFHPLVAQALLVPFLAVSVYLALQRFVFRPVRARPVQPVR